MLSVNIVKELKHFTLDVQFHVKNEVVALYGPSGSGKTTILHVIAGLTKVKEGEIELNNHPLVKGGKSLVPVQKRKIGYVFQSYALFPHMTIWENIAYAMKDEQLAKQFMAQLEIDHLVKQYPHEISGGEKQRTALIRALATEPELLLLDEPFSALDDKTKQKSIEQIITIRKGWNIPIIFVSHNREEVEALTDRVLYIQDGKLTNE